ncbi:DNA-binding protein [Nocardia tengchongensis]
MSDPIWPRGVSAPAARALAAAGYRSLGQLAGVRESELLALHGMGPKAIRVLREALVAQGLDFG